MKNLIFVAGMLCLITLFSCEKNDLQSEVSNVKTPLEQVHWDEFPEDVKRALVASNNDSISVDPEDQNDNSYRVCGKYSHKTGSVGGNGGSSFYLYPKSNCDHLSSIIIRSGIYVDAIIMVYTQPNGKIYAKSTGGSGGTWSVMDFTTDEFIKSVEVNSGIFVDHLRIKTTKNQIGWFGGSGGQFSEFDIGGHNRAIKGFHGRSGAYIDKIGGTVYDL